MPILGSTGVAGRSIGGWRCSVTAVFAYSFKSDLRIIDLSLRFRVIRGPAKGSDPVSEAIARHVLLLWNVARWPGD